MEQQIKKFEEPQLPTQSIEIFNALQSRLIKSMNDDELVIVLKKSVLRSYFEIGFKAPNQLDFDTMINAILRNIRQEPIAIREDEIQIAFSRGILKEYGDFMGLSVASFTGFIKGYLCDNARVLALNEKNKPVVVEVKEPTQDEKFNIAKSNALRAYSDVYLDKDISLYAPVVYDFLEGLKLINFSIDENTQFYNTAKAQLIKENQIKTAGKTDVIALIAIKKFIEVLQQGGQTELVFSRAKGLAAVAYLQSLIFEEIDLSPLIESKRSEYLKPAK